jgi:FAD:protein FMN transferase
MTCELRRVTFRAMGTACAAALGAEPRDGGMAARALTAAQREVAACERALSRFDSESDLSLLNRMAGEWVAVDARLIEALVAAERARRETGGRFDATILPALLAAGYDRSFELLGEREPAVIAGWRAGARVDVDPDTRHARVEAGAAVDLGGLGKGFAATRALAALRTAWPGASGALVDLGGDIALWGSPPEGGTWRVDIVDPRSAGLLAGTLALTGGGVATSGRDTRRFGPGRRLHHLIDPRTGGCAEDGPLAVTVVAASATEAEAYATALAITDAEGARAQVAERPDLGALLIPHTGDPIVLGRLPLIAERAAVRVVVTPHSGRTP